MKTLLFIPCCKGKKFAVPARAPEWITPARLPTLWADLQLGRERRKLGDPSVAKFRAICSYTGKLYAAAPMLQQMSRIVTIISAGFGLVGGNDPIGDYDLKMQGSVAKDWRLLGLDRMIAELLRNERPSHVFGFFAGPASWSSSAAMYRWFYEEGVRQARTSVKFDVAGIVCRSGGTGRSSVMGAIGTVLEGFLKSDLSPEYLRQAAARSISGGVDLTYLNLA